MQKFVINKFDSNQSLFKYIKKVLRNASLSFVYKIFRKKDVKVNGKRENDKYVLKENDEILLYITDDQYLEFTKEKELTANDEISQCIIYEDENIIVINKPRGLLVQGDGSRDKSLDIMVNEYLMYKGKEGNFLKGIKPLGFSSVCSPKRVPMPAAIITAVFGLLLFNMLNSSFCSGWQYRTASLCDHLCSQNPFSI